jgi:hypothetical protein
MEVVHLRSAMVAERLDAIVGGLQRHHDDEP